MAPTTWKTFIVINQTCEYHGELCEKAIGRETNTHKKWVTIAMPICLMIDKGFTRTVSFLRTIATRSNCRLLFLYLHVKSNCPEWMNWELYSLYDRNELNISEEILRSIFLVSTFSFEMNFLKNDNKQPKKLFEKRHLSHARTNCSFRMMRATNKCRTVLISFVAIFRSPFPRPLSDKPGQKEHRQRP